MDLCENQKINSSENNQNFIKNNSFHFSNFSIDHILSKAGENCFNNSGLQIKNSVNKIQKTVMNFQMITNKNDKQIINQNHHQLIFPVFDWLNYTRYKPPKLQRPSRLGPIKRTPGRLPRVPFSPSQLNALENAYKRSTYLSSEDANKLADELQLTNTRVKIWFQNRRARERREKRQQETTNLNTISSLVLNSEKYAFSDDDDNDSELEI